MKEFQRITVPLKYTNNIDHLLIKNEKCIPLISCKDKKKIVYSTTKDKTWNDRFLASLSWRHKEKSFGDYFSINPISKLPAWENKNISFQDLGLNPKVTEALNQNGYIYTTNIQGLSIPTLILGFNSIIGGETGNGKTLAYASSLLHIIANDTETLRQSRTPRSFIIAPSWELAKQISNVILSISKQLNINCSLLKSENDIKVDTDIIVSTPHTINAALKSGNINVNRLKCLVMDETDMLLGTNFGDSITDILKKILIQTTKPENGISIGSQLILCNATTPEHLEETFGRFVPLDTFSMLEGNSMHKLIPTVSHKFIRSSKAHKSALLITLLKKTGLNSSPFTIVFCNKNDSIKDVSHTLSENGIHHATFYKGLSMNTRQENFDSFQKGETQVLLCTDLASRGLDTIKATNVINYEFPRFISDYLHRSGRVGRVGSRGVGNVTNIISSKYEINAVQIIERSVRQGIRLPNIDTSRSKTVY